MRKLNRGVAVAVAPQVDTCVISPAVCSFSVLLLPPNTEPSPAISTNRPVPARYLSSLVIAFALNSAVTVSVALGTP